MNNKLYFILFLLSLNIVCFQAQASENDFNKVCSYFQALEKNNQVMTMTHLQRNDFILNKINKNLKPSSNARVAWEAVGSAEGSQRYVLYKSSAESVLNSEWQCEAMAKLADKTGEF
jgi:hypothetical protein